MKKSSSRMAVVTIASANYLPYVKTLMQSVRKTNPTYRRYFILVDKKTPDIDCGDLFEIIEAEELSIDSFSDMAVRYDVMELNTAVKPFAIEWLFEHRDVTSVVYLDPDIRVYRRLTELETALDNGASVVVTPHLTKPLEDGKQPNDHHMLQAGVFNLGFIAVARCTEAREFVTWWGRRLKTQGYSDVARNLFTDQRWVDLAPCFLEKLTVLRSETYNVAYWNLMQRTVSVRRGTLVYADGRLAFFHFSGLELGKPTVVSKHQNRLQWKDIAPYQQLFRDYRDALTSNGWGARPSTAYHYDKVGGLKVSSIVRLLYREVYPDAAPGASIDESFLLAMCNAPAALAADKEGLLTQLMHFLYRVRPDLQAVFDLSGVEGIRAYRNWFEVSAPREYGLDIGLASPRTSQSAETAQVQLLPSIPPGKPNSGKPWLYRRWRKARKWLVERV